MKNRILKMVHQGTEEKQTDFLDMFTATYISNQLHISRNLASQYLNELVKEGKLVKVHSRPVYFFDRAVIEKRNEMILNNEIIELDYALDLIHGKQRSKKDFQKLIGNDGSLNDCVQQCKSAMAYPPNGLPILLHGPTGTGKSYMAQLMYEYAVNHQIINPGGKLVTLNCSEYANNPELLTANLFGHKQGSFTGADKDNVGLLKAAEGGILFLDEVHCLSPESQEKLFLYMDRGIYHILGDNENWQYSKVRLIFATTENPEDVLLKTLRRRIAIVSDIPALEERPIEERKELISLIFNEESERIRKKIHISPSVYKNLITGKFTGNIGEIKNYIKAGCANAFLQNHKEEILKINIHNMPPLDPSYFSSEVLFDMDFKYGENLLDTELLRLNTERSSKVIDFYNDIIEAFRNSLEAGFHFDSFLNKYFSLQNKFYDLIIYSENTPIHSKMDYFNRILEKIFEIITSQYKINFRHNDILSFTKYLNEYRKIMSEIPRWEKKNMHSTNILRDEIKFHLKKESLVAQKISELIHNSLDIQLDDFSEVLLALNIKSYNKELDINQTPAIIISHGYSTASSIADAANKMIGNYIFDAIDMPLGVSSEQIALSIKKRLHQMGNFKEVILLVDMGSLEDIYIGIQDDIDMDIGIINNVNTKLALDIGFGIIKKESIEEILRTSSTNHISTYKYIKNRKRESIILAVCPTGLGTSKKIAELIENSLPRKIELNIQPIEYSQITTKKLLEELLEKYDIKLVIGTIHPNVKDIPFVSLEGIITNQNIESFYKVITEYLSDHEIEVFNENIIQKFSLTNILKYLTILNAEKVLEVVQSVVDKIEKKLLIKLKPNLKIGLYIHLSCLVERLITKSEITTYSNTEDFIKNEKKFIEIVKASIEEIESYFSVEIPVEEIGYIFDFIKSNNE